MTIRSVFLILMIFPSLSQGAATPSPCPREIQNWSEVEGRRIYETSDGRHLLQGRAELLVLNNVRLDRAKLNADGTRSWQIINRANPALSCDLTVYPLPSDESLRASARFLSVVLLPELEMSIQIFPYKNQNPTQRSVRSIHSIVCRDADKTLRPSPAEVNATLSPFAVLCRR